MSTRPQLIERNGAAACIWRDAPVWNGERTAAIGDFRCDDAEAGTALLALAEETLQAEGFTALIGPMNGDTWHAYRLIFESDGSQPFLLEPGSGPHDRAAFEGAGFRPISSYVSTRAHLAAAIGVGPPIVLEGVSVRFWDGSNADALIDTFFEMSTASFSARAFFKPISRETFHSLYRPVLPMIDPRFVLFAHDVQGALVGFLFGYPDKLEGDPPQTVVLKSYASLRRGVGRLLADSFHRRAQELGFTSVIHALMHVDNASFERSQLHSATAFRRYALMGRSWR